MISPCQATVIIKKKRGEVKGKVTDANTGLPMGADIWITVADPQQPDDYWEAVGDVFTTSDAITGNYVLGNAFAGACTVGCSWNYDYTFGEPQVWHDTTVPRDGSVTVDFALP